MGKLFWEHITRTTLGALGVNVRTTLEFLRNCIGIHCKWINLCFQKCEVGGLVIIQERKWGKKKPSYLSQGFFFLITRCEILAKN